MRQRISAFRVRIGLQEATAESLLSHNYCYCAMAEEWAMARFGLRFLMEDCLKDHWNDYQSRWHLLEPPLRPHQDVIDAIVAAVGEQSSDVLLLGVTPELVRTSDGGADCDEPGGAVF